VANRREDTKTEGYPVRGNRDTCSTNQRSLKVLFTSPSFFSKPQNCPSPICGIEKLRCATNRYEIKALRPLGAPLHLEVPSWHRGLVRRSAAHWLIPLAFFCVFRKSKERTCMDNLG
jgi:hypothetical protein